MHLCIPDAKSPLTGRPWLYQGECHLRTVLGCDCFRSGWPQPQAPMGTNLVVVSSPTFLEHLHLPQCRKQFPIHQFLAQACAVIPRVRQACATGCPSFRPTLTSRVDRFKGAGQYPSRNGGQGAGGLVRSLCIQLLPALTSIPPAGEGLS